MCGGVGCGCEDALEKEPESEGGINNDCNVTMTGRINGMIIE